MRGDEPDAVDAGGGGGDVPHMRGDEPMQEVSAGVIDQCSPHAWG